MKKILNYGSLNIDHVYKLDHIVLPGETLGSEGLSFFAGGKDANQSVAIAKAGAEVYHAGKIGNDGKGLLDTLSVAGVDTELVTVFDGHTGHAVIQVNKDGENSIILYGGGNKEIRTPEIDRALLIYLNPAPFSQEVKTWPLKLIDTLVVNETEASGLAGLQGPEEEILDTLTDMYPDTDIVLTAGKRGAYFGRGRTREYVPIVESQVVDTTAAGDTFLGYYLVSIIEGLSRLAHPFPFLLVLMRPSG